MRLFRIGRYLSVHARGSSDCLEYGERALEFVINPRRLWDDISCLLRIPIYDGLALEYMLYHHPGIYPWETLDHYWKRTRER